MNLYFIACYPDQDWFVQAETSAEAIELWQANREDDEQQPDAVFLIPPIDITSGSRVLAWHQDVESVA